METTRWSTALIGLLALAGAELGCSDTHSGDGGLGSAGVGGGGEAGRSGAGAGSAGASAGSGASGSGAAGDSGSGGSAAQGMQCGATRCAAGLECCDVCTGFCVSPLSGAACPNSSPTSECGSAGDAGVGSEPVSCDPFDDVDPCPVGQACCEVGRCGPVGTSDGVCEPADPTTGDCMPCACEMQPGGCPRCNAPDTPILTPDGERAIASLREGDLVMSLHGGRLIAVPIARTRQMQVANHAVVRLRLDDGEPIEVSGSHPTADGRRLDSLQPGDAIGARTVSAVELVPYELDRTYDILPASDSGTYLAGGALLSSTLWPATRD